MRRILVALVATSAALTGLTVASPAEAAKTTPVVTFNAAPEPLTAGSTLRLAGKVGTAGSQSFNGGRVDFYVKTRTSSSFKLFDSATADSKGNFRMSFKIYTSGTWYARFTGNSHRNPVNSNADYVEVRQTKTVPNYVYRWSGFGEHTGSPVGVRKSAMTVSITSECDDDHTYQSFSWNGHPDFDFDYTSWDGYSADVSTTFYPDVTKGYFELYAGSDCYTEVAVSQGTRRATVVV